MSDKLNLDTSGLPHVSPESAEEYEENADALIEKVNKNLKNREDIKSLIGDNSLQTMYENHENHVRFMANVFKLNDYDLLVRTVAWVYRTYRKHGFSYDYFPAELKAWKGAVKKQLKPEFAEEITDIYSFMLENHREFIDLAEKEEGSGLENLERDMGVAENFLEALLDGDHERSLEIARGKVRSPDDVEAFFENVIRPTMYEIGKGWEMGGITVAEEHLASSIVSRILAALYSQFVDFEYTKGKAVITATANEFHEIGSRIVADSLEMDGWDVDHLGVDTPINDLMHLLVEKRPFLLGLSVAIPFNVDSAVETIDRINEKPELKDMKVLIGGKAFNDNPGLWEETGADDWCTDSNEAVEITRDWWRDQG